LLHFLIEVSSSNRHIITNANFINRLYSRRNIEEKRNRFSVLVNIFSLFFLCDNQFSQLENLIFFFSLSILSFSSSCLAATLVSLIKTRKNSIELCHSKKKISSQLFNHHAWCAKEEKRERERERKKSVSFFASSSNGNALFRVSGFFSLSLLLFYYYVLALSVVHSRGFSERDNWVRWKYSFHSNFFFLHIHTHTHIDILREMADTLCALFDLLWFTSTRWYQLLSAGK